MTRREWIVGVLAGLFLAALIVSGGAQPVPRTIGMDPRVESVRVALPEAVAVGGTAGGALFTDAHNWAELERVALEQAEKARVEAERSRASVSRSGGGGGGGGCADGDLACIRSCESTDDYGAVSANGVYRGGYQFDQPTWESVGGTGDPAAAPPAEQDARAQQLYDQRGNQPWACG